MSRNLSFILMLLFLLLGAVMPALAQDPSATPTDDSADALVLTAEPFATEEAIATEDPSSPAALATAEATEAAPEPTPSPTPVPLGPPQDASFTFAELGISPTTIETPFGGAVMRFGLPAHWQFPADVPDAGAVLELRLDGFLKGPDGSTIDSPESYTGLLVVEYNNNDLPPIPFEVAPQSTLTINLPPEYLVSDRTDKRQELEIALDFGFRCESERQASVYIRDDSTFSLTYAEAPLALDLRQLPYPFLQRGITPDHALVVVPDEPSAGELSAVMTVAAGLGKLTDKELELELVTLSQLSQQQRQQEHLILVGLAENLPLLEEMALPLTLQNGSYASVLQGEDDGVLQLLASPWNPARAVLVVTGATEAGVSKAAQAASTAQRRVAGRGDLVIVSQVRDDAISLFSNTVPMQTLRDLGYEGRTIEGTGSSAIDFEFQLPEGYSAAGEPSITIALSHSSLLHFGESTFSAELNGYRLGSLVLSEDSANLSQQQIAVPLAALNSGTNVLTLLASLEPRDDCFDTRRSDELWLTIHPETLLNIPLTDQPSPQLSSIDLQQYPRPFMARPSLSNLAVVLPPNDPATWNTAMRLIFDLGDRVNGRLMKPKVFFSDDLPADLSATDNILAVGEPRQLPFLAQFRDVLPAPFAEGSNQAAEDSLFFQYRVPEDASYGTVQIARSPQNRDNVLLVVAGTDANGVEIASQALTRPGELQGALSGNFAIVDDFQIIASDARSESGIGVTVESVDMPSAEDTQTTAADAEEEAPADRPDWLLPAIYVTGALAGLVLLLALFSKLLGR